MIEETNGCHPAGRQRANPSRAERLAKYAKALIDAANAASSLEWVEEAISLQSEATRVQLLSRRVRETEAFREGQRGGEGVHGEAAREAEMK